MKYIFMFIICFFIIGCKYKSPKAKYTIIEVDTIAIDLKDLQTDVKEVSDIED